MSDPRMRAKGAGLAPQRNDRVGSFVSAFESETAAVFANTAPKSEHIILYVLVAMLVLSIGLSAVVKLDRVVTGQGKVVTIGGQLFVTPLGRAIVREVLVKTGDVVHKGQVLASLDPTFTASTLTQLAQKLESDEAQVARLEAEQDDKPFIPSGNGASSALQLSIWRQRQTEYQSSLADLDARVKNVAAKIGEIQHDVGEYQKRLKLAVDQEEMNQSLVDKGYVSKLQMMSSTDARVERARQLSATQSQLVGMRETLASNQALRIGFVQKWHSDIGSLLVAARTEAERTRGDWEKAKKLNELNALEAPADAIVLKIGKVSAGSVADAAQGSQQEPLFTLVPLDAPVEAELIVDARDIGFIQPGDKVEVKLDAYRFMQHGTAKGVIKTISEGSFTTDETTGQPRGTYFKARIAFTEIKLRNVPSTFRLVPGMTLAGDILVGHRTILSYLVEGALRTGSEAMREPF